MYVNHTCQLASHSLLILNLVWVLSDRCGNSSRHFTRHLHSLQASLGVWQTNKPLWLAPGLKHTFCCGCFPYQYGTSRMSVLELLIFCMHNGKLAAHLHTLLVSCQLGSSFFSGVHICFGASTSTPVSKGLTKEETENKWTASVSYWSEKIVEIVKCCLLICNSLSVLRDFAGV